VAIRDDDATPADQPSPAVTVPPTSPPLPLSRSHGQLEPGTYFVDEVAGIPTPRIFATLGAGWSKSADGWHIAKSDDNRTLEESARDNNMTPEEAFDEGLQHAVGVMEFSHPIAVYSDACHPGDGNHPGPLNTVDGLVAALSEQQGWAEVTAPSDISVNGYVGKAFQRTAPADMSDCDTRNLSPRVPQDVPEYPDFRSWENPDEPAGWAGFYYEPGWIETLWVLDLNGTMVVITTGVWPEPSAGAGADFAADVLDSIRIADAPTTPGFDTIDSEVDNPLELVQGSLMSGADVELFRVTADEPRYWRLTTLPEFDGRTWRVPSSALSSITDTAEFEPDGRIMRQRLQILALQGQLLPVAADPTQVAPFTDIRRSLDTATLFKTSELASGDQYTIVSEAPDVTLDELRTATTDNPPDDLFLELPDDVPSLVSGLATQITAAATSDADKMIALQDWLRGGFDYDATVPASDGYAAIEMFLETRSGFSEQFASTFAMMARTLGIPSRVAVGFTPGQLNADGSYRVTGKNAHVWPEIWFDGIGWIPFEPTPQRGIPGAEKYTGVPAEQAAP
jgi:transglutaminase-like putative cysteine protease